MSTPAAAVSSPFPNAAPGWTFHTLLSGEGSGIYYRYPSMNVAGTKIVYRTGSLCGSPPATVHLADLDLSTFTVSNSAEIDTSLTPPGGGTYDWYSHPEWSQDGSKILFLAGSCANDTPDNVPYGDLVIYDVGTSSRTIYHFSSNSPNPGVGSYDTLWFENSDFIGASTHNIVFEYDWEGSGGGTIWTVDLNNLSTTATRITGYAKTVNTSPMNRIDPTSNYAGDLVIHWRGPDNNPAGVVQNTEQAGGTGEGTSGFGPGYWAAYSGRPDDKILSTGNDWNGTAIRVYGKDGTLLLDLLGAQTSNWQYAYSWKGWEGPLGGILFRADGDTSQPGNSVFLATNYNVTAVPALSDVGLVALGALLLLGGLYFLKR